ncbi:O-antigen ligase family protein [Photobacterium leiognathi]|uniref:O-antigen ligase family protein n=1 Tax=Photobacterium leiognathi TaxID=553611 RepID=UPI002980A389|nr:O-antigen ligase family protein [Photobacterium leiognathi]
MIAEIVFGFNFPGSRFYGHQVWYSKPTAFYYNENDAAFVLVCLNIILLDGLGSKIKSFLVIFSVFILLYIGSKAALLSITSVLILHYIYHIKNKIRLFILLFIVFACSITFLMQNQFFIEILSRTFERFNEFYQGLGTSGGDTSTKDRILIYEAAMSMIGNNFFRFLFGYESFNYYRANLLLDTSAPLADFHNINSELIVMFGIFGFLLFLMYVFYLSFSLFRTGDIYSSLSLLVFVFLSTFGPSSTFRSAIIWVLLLYFTIKVRKNISN